MRHCTHCGHHHITDHTPRCGAYTTDLTGFHKCCCDGRPREVKPGETGESGESGETGSIVSLNQKQAA